MPDKDGITFTKNELREGNMGLRGRGEEGERRKRRGRRRGKKQEKNVKVSRLEAFCRALGAGSDRRGALHNRSFSPSTSLQIVIKSLFMRYVPSSQGRAYRHLKKKVPERYHVQVGVPSCHT